MKNNSHTPFSKQKENPNIELERKKASQILHYLMERKQHQDFSDPFELLRNMQDVIQIYEKPSQNSATTPNASQSTNSGDITQSDSGACYQNQTHQDNSNQTRDESLGGGTQKQLQKPFRKTLGSFYQGGNSSKMNSSFYGNNNSAHKSKRGLLNRESNLNKSLEENPSKLESSFLQSRGGNRTLKNNMDAELNSDLPQLNEYQDSSFTDYSKVQLPQIMRKQLATAESFHHKPSSQSAGMRSTKTFLSRKEEKILDISNLIDAAQPNFEPDALQLKYEKLKKLRDEFNDIKVQFNIPEPKYIDPNQMNNSSLLSYKRENLKSRGSLSTASNINANFTQTQGFMGNRRQGQSTANVQQQAYQNNIAPSLRNDNPNTSNSKQREKSIVQNSKQVALINQTSSSSKDLNSNVSKNKMQTNTSQINEQKIIPLSLSEIKEVVRSNNADLKQTRSKQRPMTSAQIPVKQVKELREARQIQNEYSLNKNNKQKHNQSFSLKNQRADSSPSYRQNQNLKFIHPSPLRNNKFSSNNSLSEFQKQGSYHRLTSSSIGATQNTHPRRSMQRRRRIFKQDGAFSQEQEEEFIMDEQKLMTKMGNSAIMNLTDSNQKQKTSCQNKPLSGSFSIPFSLQNQQEELEESYNENQQRESFEQNKESISFRMQERRLSNQSNPYQTSYHQPQAKNTSDIQEDIHSSFQLQIKASYEQQQSRQLELSQMREKINKMKSEMERQNISQNEIFAQSKTPLIIEDYPQSKNLTPNSKAEHCLSPSFHLMLNKQSKTNAVASKFDCTLIAGKDFSNISSSNKKSQEFTQSSVIPSRVKAGAKMFEENLNLLRKSQPASKNMRNSIDSGSKREFLAISSRSQQPSCQNTVAHELEAEGQRFSTINAVSQSNIQDHVRVKSNFRKPSFGKKKNSLAVSQIGNAKDLDGAKESRTTMHQIGNQGNAIFELGSDRQTQKHSSLMRTRNLESIEEEETLQNNRVERHKQNQNSINSQSIQTSSIRKSNQLAHSSERGDNLRMYAVNQLKMMESIERARNSTEGKGIPLLQESLERLKDRTPVASKLPPNPLNMLIDENIAPLIEKQPQISQSNIVSSSLDQTLYEQYKQNQQRQIEALKKKKRKEKKKLLKQYEKLKVESVYMREAILALIHSQQSSLNPLKVRSNPSSSLKHRKKSQGGGYQSNQAHQNPNAAALALTNHLMNTTVAEMFGHQSHPPKRAKSSMQKRFSKKQSLQNNMILNEDQMQQFIITNQKQLQGEEVFDYQDQQEFMIKNQDDIEARNHGQEQNDCAITSLSHQNSKTHLSNRIKRDEEKESNYISNL